MAADQLRYDLLVQDALRGMVRRLLADTAKKGLPGDHHFFVTFDTTAPGVRLSDRLRERYPEEMTIVLQHQFWDLKIGDEAFEVGLSFGGVPERLAVPFTAIKGFADPSVQFALQFETLLADGSGDADITERESGGKPVETSREPKRRTRTPAKTSVPTSGTRPADEAQPQSATTAASSESNEAPGDKPGAEVVRLDRFRKK